VNSFDAEERMTESFDARMMYEIAKTIADHWDFDNWCYEEDCTDEVIVLKTGATESDVAFVREDFFRVTLEANNDNRLEKLRSEYLAEISGLRQSLIAIKMRSAMLSSYLDDLSEQAENCSDAIEEYAAFINNSEFDNSKWGDAFGELQNKIEFVIRREKKKIGRWVEKSDEYFNSLSSELKSAAEAAGLNYESWEDYDEDLEFE
jgi:hypothetical protein